jgi:hypothetical protein
MIKLGASFICRAPTRRKLTAKVKRSRLRELFRVRRGRWLVMSPFAGLDPQVMKVLAYERYSHGWDDPRGLFTAAKLEDADWLDRQRRWWLYLDDGP